MITLQQHNLFLSALAELEKLRDLPHPDKFLNYKCQFAHQELEQLLQHIHSQNLIVKPKIYSDESRESLPSQNH